VNRRTITHTTIGGLLLLASYGCQTTGRESQSIHRVDDLLTNIERVHFQSELGQERVREALGALHEIVAPEFGGDPVADYGAFVLALEASEEQAEELRDSLAPMRSSADALFDRWTTDLSAFSNPEMRARSRERLDATRRRYQAILTALEPTQADFESFNLALRDCALYLGHDFNGGAVRSLAPMMRDLTKRAKQLDVRLDACMKAAGNYIETSALRGQIQDDPPLEPAPVAPAES